VNKIKITLETIRAIQEDLAVLLTSFKDKERRAEKEDKKDILQNIIELNHDVQACKTVIKLLEIRQVESR